MTKDKKVQWHPAFYGAMHLELRENKEQLDFTEELKNINENHMIELITSTQELVCADEKKYADSLWEVVATLNKDMVEKIREDEKMCKALAEIMKPEIDEAFNDGFNDGKILIFKNMIKDGLPRELAQKYAEINDEVAEKVLLEV